MFKLHKWNKKYGNAAKFIAEDAKGKFTEFSPSNPKDLVWVDTNLAESNQYKDWDDFGQEPVEDLDDVIM